MPIESPNQPVTKIVELDLDGLSREAKTRAKQEAGRIIVEGIQSALDASKSPVSGGDFKTKKKDGKNSRLLEFGDMRDEIEFKSKRGNQIEVGVFNRSETAKAYGHNTDFEGHPHLDGKGNKRQFIPEENQNFKRNIISEVNAAIDDIRVADQSTKEERSRITVADVLTALDFTTPQEEESQVGISAILTLADLFSEDI